MTKRQTVAIVGAGLGGLTAALAFARNGAEVFVLERAPELQEVGAGIQITPNGTRVLNALGLESEVEKTGVSAKAVVPVDGITGQQVTRFDLSQQTPSYRFFHRAQLLHVIGTAAQAAGAVVHLGVTVTGVSADGKIESSNGTFKADIVVGADGINSVLRHYVSPDATPATFTGQVAWRAVVPMHAMSPEARIWMAPGKHVVTYPLSDEVMNIVAVQERAHWAQEGWSHHDTSENFQSAFSDLAPQIRQILSGVEQPHVWGLFRHPVAPVWHKGPVALLGDAAHPTLPFLAQGANLAIEDAYVLARCCQEHRSVRAAFARYQQLRRDRVVRAISAANANARNYHLSGPRRTISFLALKTLGAVAPNAFLNRLSWLYDHDVTI